MHVVPRFHSQLILSIGDCLHDDKRIGHKFFNLVLSSLYTYNVQYDMPYYYIISIQIKNEDMKQ